MNQKYTQIKGFRRFKYLPRLGKIRLGVKAVSKRTGAEYPKEVDYFVCPPEVMNAAPIIGTDPENGKPIYGPPFYGEKPKVLDIMFPSEDPAEVIPFCYKCYGANQRLKCKGDGESATYFDPATKEMVNRKCPCEALEKGDCAQRGHLMVILPLVNIAGVYQVDTGSSVNINRVLDAMNYWTQLVQRCTRLPLTLERVEEKILNPNDGTMQSHYLFRFGTKMNLDLLNRAIEYERKYPRIEYKVQPPVEEGKLEDTPVEVVEEAEVIEKEPGSQTKTAGEPKEEKKFRCENCNGPVTQGQAAYSQKHFNGRVLCFKCRKGIK